MLKQTKFEDKTVKSTPLSLVLVGHHDFQIFLDRMVSVFFVRAGSQIYLLPWENKISQMPYPRANKDNQMPTPCPASPPPPRPAGMTLIGALSAESSLCQK